MATSRQTLKQKVYHATQEFLIITLYLWVIFELFDLYKSVLVAQYHIGLVARSFALINALALAKIALIARELHLDQYLRRSGKPLIYATLVNAAVFSTLLASFKILEEAAVGMYHGKPIAQSLAEFGGSGRGLLCLMIIFFVTLIPFCAFIELGTFLGDGELTQLFFREHRMPSGAASE